MNRLASRFIRGFFSFFGLTVFRRRTLPRGISLEADLRRLLTGQKSPLVIDGGANTGQTTERVKAALPSSRVYAFEPVSRTFADLRRRTERLPDVFAKQLALGSRDGTAIMKLGAQSGWSKVMADEHGAAGDRTERVAMTRLDTFCRNEGIDHIDLLKTDCEGHDLEVLLGAEDMIRRGRIDCVYCEVNFRADGRHGDFYEIDAKLQSHGFVLYGFYDYSHWKYNVATQGFTNALWVHSHLLAQVGVDADDRG